MQFASMRRYLALIIGSGVAFTTASCSSMPQVRIIGPHTNRITAIAIDPRRAYFATCADDSLVRIWGSPDFQLLRTLIGNTRGVDAMAATKTGLLITGDRAGTIRVWRAMDGKAMWTITLSRDAITVLSLSPDERLLAVGTLGGSVIIVNRYGSSQRKVGNLQGSSVTGIAWTPAGDAVIYGGYDGRLLRSVITPRQHSDLIGEFDRAPNIPQTTHLALQPTARRIVAVHGKQLFLLDSAGTKLHEAPRSDREYGPIACSSLGAATYIVQAGGTVRIYDAARNAFMRTLAVPSKFATALSVSADNQFLIGGDFSSAWCVNLLSGATRSLRDSSALPAQCYAGTKEGDIIAAGAEGDVSIWDLRTGRHRYVSAHNDKITAIGIDRKSNLLVTAGEDERLRAWRLDSLAPIGTQALARYSFVRTLRVNTHFVTLVLSDLFAGNSLELWNEAGTAFQHLGRLRAEARMITISPNGRYVAYVENGHVRLRQTGLSDDETDLPLESKNDVRALVWSGDSERLLGISARKAFLLWTLSSPQGRSLERRSVALCVTGPVRADFTDRNVVIAAWGAQVEVCSLGPFGARRRKTLPQGDIAWVRDLRRNELIAIGHYDGTIRLLDRRNLSERAQLYAFRDGHWFVVAPDGRFDTDDLDGITGMNWVFSDDPFHGLPPEIYVRDYFEPHLLMRLLHPLNGSYRYEFRKIRPLQELNRAQPRVKELRVRRVGRSDRVEVFVDVAGSSYQVQNGNKSWKTKPYDLRLFRDGQLVGECPEDDQHHPLPVGRSAYELKVWRARTSMLDSSDSRIVARQPDGTVTVRFEVRLPHRPGGKVKFSAYAFNEDRVKSQISLADDYPVPDDLPSAQPKAYLVTIGVNDYESASWRLEFPVNDAAQFRKELEGRLESAGYRVVPISLVTNAVANDATKDKIHAVLDLLSGRIGQPGPTAKLPMECDALQRATPDDLVLITFSGHGYANEGGEFYLAPSDIGTGQSRVQKPSSKLLRRLISGEELSQWLRGVDAGQLALIIDACQSAASVDAPWFKPGPLGNQGLGQLAYDKGMRVLAACQADDVALESGELKQGLLSYALTCEGLAQHEAADEHGRITLSGLLEYAERRVPDLYKEMQANGVTSRCVTTTQPTTVGRTLVSKSLRAQQLSINKPNAFQKPALFDFAKGRWDVDLNVQNGTGRTAFGGQDHGH